MLSGAPPLTDPPPCLIITLVGTETVSQPIRLQRLDSSGYIPGRPDTFSIQCPSDVGTISKLKVQYCNCYTVLIIYKESHMHTSFDEA